MALTTTPGALNADSLASLAEAEAYMGMILPAYKDAWAAADDQTKESVLRQASMLLYPLPWVGHRASQGQPLCWPRIPALSNFTLFGGLRDSDGYPIDSTTIPWQVKNATVAFAFRLLSEDRTADAGALVPTDLKSGTTSITGLKRNPIPAEVLDMVSPLLRCDPRYSAELVRS